MALQYIIIITIIIIKMSSQCNPEKEWERSINLKTEAHTTNPWKVEKKETAGDKKCIDTKIVVKSNWDEHNGSAVLRSPAARRIEQTSAYEKSTTRNTHWTKDKFNAILRGCIEVLWILNSIHSTATDRRWAKFNSKTPPDEKTAIHI